MKREQARKRKSNREMLTDRLSVSHFERWNPKPLKDRKKTSCLQSMAHLLAMELLSLSAGMGECAVHDGFVMSACPKCDGTWPA